ncbi:MAG: hypothetical protein NZ959_01665 [Armatimonadetes bacterium]|nr:hypothetical protein [Armatimonadota bacterium]MDW8121368.1 hypothetical protein [Armatimonadota bacterium]
MKKMGLLILFLLPTVVAAEPFDEILSVSLSPKGRWLAACENFRLKVHIFEFGKDGIPRIRQVLTAKDLNLRVWIPTHSFWSTDDRLIVTDGSNGTVNFFRWDGKRFRHYGTVGRVGGASLFRQVGAAAVWRDLLFVIDELGDRILVFRLVDQAGLRADLLSSFGEEGIEVGQLNNPTDIAVSEDGLIFIAENLNARVSIWKWDDEKKTAVPHEPYTLTGFWTSRSVEICDGHLYVLSSHTGEIKSLPLNRLKDPVWHSDGGFLAGDGRTLSAVHSGHRLPSGRPSLHSIFAAEKVPDVFSFGRYGTPVFPLRDFSLVSTDKGRLLAFCRGKEIWVKKTPPPTRPDITPEQTGALVSWRTVSPQPTVVEVREAGPFPDLATSESREKNWIRKDLPGKRTHHRIWLSGLKPGTLYRLRIPLTGIIKIADPDQPMINPWSFEFSFATLPDKGKTTFLRIPIALVVYADVVNRDSLTPDAPPPPPVSREYLDYLRYEVERACLFYWCNSKMKVWLDVDWFVIDKRIWVGEKEPGQIDWRRDLEALLRLRGRSLSQYPAAMEIVCERRWDPKRQVYYFQGSGGGTYGADMRPGSSHFLGGSDIAWLFVHEFHHQLDSQFSESGYPEHPFNHFSITPEGFADNFGEHYDGNAWILRNWHEGKEYLWFVNKFGDLVSVDDRDEDGIPDDCPAVPLDERRFGSSPDAPDSDGDGLSDRDEVLASSWVRELLPSVNNFRMKYVMPDPQRPDSDGDGIPDGHDPLPLIAAAPVVVRSDALPTYQWLTFEEDLSPVPAPEPLARPLQPLKGSLRMFHNGEWLTVVGEWDQPIRHFHLQLDANQDGYWVGADNLDVRVDPDWSQRKVQWKATINNGSDPTRWPFPDESLVPAEHITVRIESNGTSSSASAAYPYRLIISIKRTDTIGLELKRDENIGVAFYLRVDHQDRWLSVFEPYRLVPLTLQ